MPTWATDLFCCTAGAAKGDDHELGERLGGLA